MKMANDPARPQSHAQLAQPATLTDRQMPRVLNFKTDGLPAGAIYIGRAMARYGLHGSKWSNPFGMENDGTRDAVIAQYERFLCDTPEGAVLRLHLGELQGRDLVCWCAPQRCHGDVLVAQANGSAKGQRAVSDG
jgi:Domain of unknown function (DUF4326)